MPSNFNIQKVLVAPLDWGLGHATRCVPVIRALTNNGYQVLIAAEGAQANLLQTEFPAVPMISLKGYRVRYSKNKTWLPFVLLMQLPRLFRVIRHENRWLDSIIKEHAIDLVISDNRYGLSSQKIPCIFITHQLTIKTPFGWLEKIIQHINYRFINRFTTCWVPDVAGEPNAAGLLSHPATLPRTKVQYIGLLSRFHTQAVSGKYDCCFLLSGPEPQRTLLEQKIIKTLSGIKGRILLVRGKPGSHETWNLPGNITVKNHLPGTELEKAILQSEYIICRSGYTTIMELLSLRKKAVLIPTPGQTEQEYLAQKLQQDNICMAVGQELFTCSEYLSSAQVFPYRLTTFPLFNEGQLTHLLKASV